MARTSRERGGACPAGGRRSSCPRQTRSRHLVSTILPSMAASFVIISVNLHPLYYFLSPLTSPRISMRLHHLRLQGLTEAFPNEVCVDFDALGSGLIAL